MHAKTNRVNSDFQILHFLVGSCHTADGAYALLCDQRDDRADALAHYEAARLRIEEKRVRAERKAASEDEAEQLAGRADLVEIAAGMSTTLKNVAAAKDELAFINLCIERLRPFRLYASLPDPQAHQAAQQEEWKLELINRAQNYLLAGGAIPPDQFGTMRMHPAFASEIYPAIGRIQQLAVTPGGRQQLITARPAERAALLGFTQPIHDLPHLLGAPDAATE